MATRQPATVLRSDLLPGDPVSLVEAAALAGTTTALASRALIYLSREGVFQHVRRRLWVRNGAAPDPYRIAARITTPYAFAYGSALTLHGAGPSERSELLVSSPHRFTSFAFDGVRYRWVRPWDDDGLVQVSVGPEFVRATSPERTLVECTRVPANAGGIEELARAVDLLPALHAEEVVRWVDHYAEAALAARLGYLLERSGLYAPETALVRALLERRPAHRVYLTERRRGGRLVSRWNLIVPAHLALTGA